MDTISSAVRLEGVAIDRQEPTDALRVAQYRMLEELPGAIFGLITLVYIIGAIVALM